MGECIEMRDPDKPFSENYCLARMGECIEMMWKLSRSLVVGLARMGECIEI